MLTAAQPGRGLQSLWYAGDQLTDRRGVIMLGILTDRPGVSVLYWPDQPPAGLINQPAQLCQ